MMKRHLRFIIKQLPVVCRWKNKKYTGTAAITDGVEAMASGGIMDLRTIDGVHFVREDFVKALIPATADLFYIQDPATDEWIERAVKDAKEDQSGVGLIVSLESPDV